MSLRNLMSQRKSALRVSHPFARYDGKGQLHCTLCQPSLIKNEQLWSAHLSSKGHRGKAQEYATEQQRQQQQEAANQARQQEQDAEQSRKRSAIDEELDEEAQPKRQRVNGSSPIPEHSQDQPAAVPEEEEDAEWAALERDILAEPVIPSSTNMSSQPGVISAAPKLIDPNNPPESDEGTPAEPKEVDEDEPKETEDERRERENNEELMLRIDEEEREQQEADARVSALKSRLEAMKKRRQKS